MSRLFRYTLATYHGDKLNQVLTALARSPDNRRGKPTPLLAQKAEQAISTHIKHLTIDQCLELYRSIQPGHRFCFVRRHDGYAATYYDRIVLTLQARVLQRTMLKHPYLDHSYKSGEYAGHYTRLADTLHRIKPLIDAPLLTPGTRSGHKSTYERLWRAHLPGRQHNYPNHQIQPESLYRLKLS